MIQDLVLGKVPWKLTLLLRLMLGSSLLLFYLEIYFVRNMESDVVISISILITMH
jgi:hypothetical protein